MFLPVALYYIIFCYLPMYGIVIAFQDYKPGMSFFSSAEFVGLKNFQELFASPMFPKLIINTLMLNLWELMVGFPAPIILALLLNELRSQKFKRVVQTISYLPHFIAMVVVIGILKDVLSSEGLFNQIRQFVHVNILGLPLADFKPILYLNMPKYFRPIYTLSGVWQGIGWGSIIYLSTLSSIDPQLYEAAEIDGAKRFRKMLSITLPGISPTVIIMLIFAVGGLMNTGFEKLILLYQPLPVENEEIFDHILTLTQALSNYAISVDRIQYDSRGNADLYIGDIQVVLGDNADLNGKISALNDMLPSLEGMSGILYLDTFDETNTSMMYTFKKK